MADVQWYTIVIPLVGGGAMGALINASVSACRNRMQAVGQRIEFLAVFRDTLGTSSLRTQVTVSDGQSDHRYDNLHIGQVQLVNRGNKDFGEFKVGITLSAGDVVIYQEPKPPDRLHQAKCLTPITLADPKSEVDFVLRPFNRGDAYTVQLFIVTAPEKERPGEIELSSTEAIRFVAMPTITEALAEAARYVTFIELGPVRVSFLR
jgi:hypothetical protein